MHKPGIAIHGGAGSIQRLTITPEREQLYQNALREALHAGYAIIQQGGSALDSVEAAIRHMEDCPLFNAGRGSVYNHEGKHEMDAGLMWGKDLRAGAVAMIKKVKNPVSLARAVMEQSAHVFLCGEGAEVFARQCNLAFEPDAYFDTDLRYEQWQKALASEKSFLDHSATDDKKFGTVGAVALDINGNLAAGTSTGGMTNKKFGRIGDSAIPGAGVYANNNTCAVSCTGHGELFIRAVAAYDVSCLMEYRHLSLAEACREVIIKKLPAIQGEGGLIAIDKLGNIEMMFNTEGMYRAMKNADGEAIAIYR